MHDMISCQTKKTNLTDKEDGPADYAAAGLTTGSADPWPHCLEWAVTSQ